MHAFTSGLPLVLLEDTAAMYGLFFAYSGITLTLVTNNNIYDGIASILVGLVLTVVSWILAREIRRRIKHARLISIEPDIPEEGDVEVPEYEQKSPLRKL